MPRRILPLSVAVCATMGCSEGWAESVVQGPLTAPFGDLGEIFYDPEGKGKSQLYRTFTGINKTKLPIKDFELELVNCGQKAKFVEIKIFPEVDPNKEFPGGLSGDAMSDWDVDDNMSGLSNQDTVIDEGASGNRANETDNVDDSPDTKARVDANGVGDDGATGTRGQAVRDAAQRGTEDTGEKKPGNQAGDESVGPLEGPGGIQDGHRFQIYIRLTDPPEGKDCKITIQPSGSGGGLITAPGELKAKPKGFVPRPPAPEDDAPFEPLGEPEQPEGTPPETPGEEKPPEKPEDGKSAETPEDTKYGQAPGGCPEGKFMGGLGSLLGLEVACEEPSRRRDTDRSEHRGDEHKD